MSNTTISTALAHVADVLGSSGYDNEEVFIIIPNIHLAGREATGKVSQAPTYFRTFVDNKKLDI